MKKHFLITIVLILNCLMTGKSQKLETFSVGFKTAFKDSITYTEDKSFRDEFCILKDNLELPFKNCVKNKNGKKIKVSGLMKGNYIVRYENIFAQLIDAPLVITRKRLKNTRIYLDEFIDTVKMSFFEKLKDRDSLAISYIIRGCDGGSDELIEVVKKNDSLNARLFKYIDLFPIDSINKETGKKVHFFEYQKPVKTFIKEKVITTHDITLMKHIFKRLEMLSRTWDGHGSIERTYAILINDKLIRVLYNDSDNWNSFNYLKDKIFGIKPK